MKNIFIVALLVTSSIHAIAQIPNNSFENWTTIGAYSDPDNWGTLNTLTTTSGVYTAMKGTGGASGGGASYIKIVSRTITGLGTVPGIVVSGTLDPSTYKASGFPFIEQPASLTGAWQYMASGSDQGFISILLTKWNSTLNKRDTIAYKKQLLSGMAMSWANFTIPLTYFSTNLPDSALIILSASGTTPVSNSYMYADKLAFSGTVAGLNVKNTAMKTSVYPNPAGNKLFIENLPARVEKIEIVDIVGKAILIKNENINEIDISSYQSGMYILKVYSEGKVLSNKFYKN